MKIVTKNLVARVVSGVVMLLAFGISLIYPQVLLYVVMPAIGYWMLLEWYNITKTSRAHLISGLFIIPLPIVSMMLLCTFENYVWVLCTYFGIIVCVDTFAMIGGKILKGPKLAAKISPNKTWSGLIVAIISALLFVHLLLSFETYSMHQNFTLHINAWTIVFVILAQLSDLFESSFKRRFNFKNSGYIIPGHGGVLDRFDSTIFTAPLFLCMLLF